MAIILAPKIDAPPTLANPFNGDLARRHSHHYGIKGGKAVLMSKSREAPDLFASAVIGAFRGFVLNPSFSCLGAKSAMMHESIGLGIYDQLGGPGETLGLCRDLFTFAAEVDRAGDDGEFRTFAAIFRQPMGIDEREFERLLWDQLRSIHQQDSAYHSWDPSVSDDPESPHFGFSFASKAFFIVGLHPHSSREARRFPWPTLVFNPHQQFQALRGEGRWDRLQQVIRTREEQLQGSLNPNLADHGTATEARQYSGRAVEADWHAPFHSNSSHWVAGRPGVGACPFLASLNSANAGTLVTA